MKVYHATPEKNLPAIMKLGLLSRKAQDIDAPGNYTGLNFVCVAENPDTALCYGARSHVKDQTKIALLSANLDVTHLKEDTTHDEIPYGPGCAWLVFESISPAGLTIEHSGRYVSNRFMYETRRKLLNLEKAHELYEAHKWMGASVFGCTPDSWAMDYS